MSIDLSESRDNITPERVRDSAIRSQGFIGYIGVDDKLIDMCYEESKIHDDGLYQEVPDNQSVYLKEDYCCVRHSPILIVDDNAFNTYAFSSLLEEGFGI